MLRPSNVVRFFGSAFPLVLLPCCLRFRCGMSLFTISNNQYFKIILKGSPQDKIGESEMLPRGVHS